MTVEPVSRSELDIERWDGLVARSPGATPFHQASYLDAVAPGWTALLLGDYEWAMPVVVKRIGGHSIVAQPTFTRESRVVGSTEPSEAVIRLFAAHLRGYKEVRIGMPETQAAHFAEPVRTDRTYQILGIDRDPEAIRQGYSANIQRILRKPPEGVIVAQSDHVGSILELWRATTYRKMEGLGPQAASRLRSLLQTSRRGEWGFGVVARAGDEILAAAWFLRFREQLLFLVSGMSEVGRKAGAMTLILDAAITRHAAGAQWFDFGGSDVPSIAGFFRRFGSEDRHYVMIERDGSPRWLRGARALRRWIKR